MKSQDVCEQITQAIIAELERGVMPWAKPWTSTGGPVMPRRHTGARYRGINVVILWGKAEEAGYRSRYWMTFKQAREYGGNVRKGEKGTQIVYTNRVTRIETNDAGNDIEHSFGFLKAYTVFNAEQIENLPVKFLAPAAPVVTPEPKDWAAYESALAFFDAIPAEVVHGGAHAVYIPSLDRIELPNRDDFHSARAYLSTRAHETAHWTKHESRLNRDFGAVRWGDQGHAMEELCAELAAAYAMAELELVPAVREDHAPYIANWLSILKHHSRAMLTAAAKASDALEFMCQFQERSDCEESGIARAA